MIPDAITWERIKQAHAALAQAQNSGNSKGATKAWRELSDLIEGVATDSGAELSIDERRSEVVDALFEAAKERSVPAIMKWLNLHRGQFDSISDGSGDSETEGSERSHSQMIEALEKAFPDLASHS